MNDYSVLIKGLCVNAHQALQPQKILGIGADMWMGTGVGAVQDACIKSSNTSSDKRSAKTLPACPEMRFAFMGAVDSTAFYIATAVSGGDGYRITFPTTSTMKVERLDSGSATEILTGTLSASLGSTSWIGLVFRVLADRIEIEVDGELFMVADVTHRLTTWYLFLDHSATFYVLVGHLLAYSSGILTYQSAMHDVNWWNADMSAVAASLALSAGWDVKYVPFLLPKTGWQITFNITPGSHKYSSWGVCSPDGKHGVYVRFLQVGGQDVARMYDMDDNQLALSTDVRSCETFTLECGTTAYGGGVRATIPSWTDTLLSYNSLSKMLPNMLIFCKADYAALDRSGSKDAYGVTVNSVLIEAAATAMTYGTLRKQVGDMGGSVSALSGGGLPIPTADNGGLL